MTKYVIGLVCFIVVVWGTIKKDKHSTKSLDKLRLGSVVRYEGITMTVDDIIDEDIVECIYRDLGGNLQKDLFLVSQLELVYY